MDLGANATGYRGKMNKLKQIFSAGPSASSVSGPAMADGIAAPPVTQAFPSACTLVALTKGGSGRQNENASMYV
jgi:hypothetical protein